MEWANLPAGQRYQGALVVCHKDVRLVAFDRFHVSAELNLDPGKKKKCFTPESGNLMRRVSSRVYKGRKQRQNRKNNRKNNQRKPVKKGPNNPHGVVLSGSKLIP